MERKLTKPKLRIKIKIVGISKTKIVKQQIDQLAQEKNRKMWNHKKLRLLKSNSNVGHSLNKVFLQKLTQKLHITINGYLTY